MTHLKRRAIKGAVWAALGGNGAQVLSFVMFVLISRVVGPEAFGVVAVCLLLVEVARALTVEAVAVNLVAAGRLDRGAFNAGAVMSSGSAIAASVLLILAAPLLAQIFNIAALRAVLPQIAPLLIVHSLGRLFEADLTVRMEFRRLAFCSVGAVALGGGAGIVGAYAGQGVTALVTQQWVGTVSLLLFLALQAQWRPSAAFSRDDFTALARHSAVLAPAGVITNLKLTLDGMAVASFSGATVAGFYNLAKRTRLALQLGLTAAIGRVSLPAFSAVKDDARRLASAFEQAMRLSSVVAFPLFIGVAAVGPELIQVFLSPEWAPAAAPMVLLMIGGAITITTRLCENLLLVYGRRDIIVATNVFALLTLVCLLAVFGRNGPVAVAGAVLVVGILQNIAAWFASTRQVRLSLRAYIASVWAPLAICVAMLMLIMFARDAGLGHALPAVLRLVLYVGVGAAFYFAASWAFARPALRAAFDVTRLVLFKAHAKP